MSSKEFFGQIASEWDERRERYYSVRVREKAMDIANVEAGQTAADLGAGTGFITEGLLQRKVKVIAVDQSAEMLAELKRKFPAEPFLDCREGEAARLPLSDASVDYAFANMYLHHVETPGEAIKEMARILKPGGCLVVTDAETHEFDFLRREHHDRWLGFDRGDLKRWFEEAGLREVSVRALDELCCVDSEEGCESARISIFAASGTK